VIGKKLITFFSNCTGMAARFCAVPRWPTMAKILSLLTSFCAASTALLGVVAVVLDQQADLAAVTPPMLVGLVHAHLHAVADLFAVAGQRARQVLDGAQRDLGLGCRWRSGPARRRRNQRQQCNQCDCLMFM
jgi:hypothetical protein